MKFKIDRSATFSEIRLSMKKTEKPFKVLKAKERVKNTQENTYDGHKAILDYYQNNNAKFIGTQIISNR